MHWKVRSLHSGSCSTTINSASLEKTVNLYGIDQGCCLPTSVLSSDLVSEVVRPRIGPLYARVSLGQKGDPYYEMWSFRS